MFLSWLCVWHLKASVPISRTQFSQAGLEDPLLQSITGKPSTSASVGLGASGFMKFK